MLQQKAGLHPCVVEASRRAQTYTVCYDMELYAYMYTVTNYFHKLYGITNKLIALTQKHTIKLECLNV